MSAARCLKKEKGGEDKQGVSKGDSIVVTYDGRVGHDRLSLKALEKRKKKNAQHFTKEARVAPCIPTETSIPAGVRHLESATYA